jgi:predicted DNA-binding ribbon-helix-helix protein
MCRVFASQSPQAYELITRSVRLNGYSTSIRLEAYFWSVLDEIAARQKMSTPRFISTLYDEVLELRGEVGNFTSLLRVTCALYIDSLRDKPAAALDAKAEAA